MEESDALRLMRDWAEDEMALIHWTYDAGRKAQQYAEAHSIVLKKKYVAIFSDETGVWQVKPEGGF